MPGNGVLPFSDYMSGRIQRVSFSVHEHEVSNARSLLTQVI